MHETLQTKLGDSYVPIVGAGVSRNSPTCLPIASMVIETLYQSMRTILNVSLPPFKDTRLTGARFEVVVEALRRAVGDEVTIITELLRRIFAEDKPNAIHRAVVNELCNNASASVVTTNFDRCLELADEKNNITVISTDSDAQKYTGASRGLTIMKLHGCISKPDDMIASIRQVGRGLSLPPHLKRCFVEAIKDRVLLMAGYSVGDDFDINPLLEIERDQLRGVVYIKHLSDCTTPINFDLGYKDKWTREHDEIAIGLPLILLKLSDAGVPVHIIAADTHFLFTNEVSPKAGSCTTNHTEVAVSDWCQWLKNRNPQTYQTILTSMLGMMLSVVGEHQRAVEVYSKYLEDNVNKETSIERQLILLLRARAYKALGCSEGWQKTEADILRMGPISNIRLRAAALRTLLFTLIDNGTPIDDERFNTTVASLEQILQEAKHAEPNKPCRAHVARDLVWYEIRRGNLEKAHAYACISVKLYETLYKSQPELIRQLAWSRRDLSWVQRYMADNSLQSSKQQEHSRGLWLFSSAERNLQKSLHHFEEAGDIENMAWTRRDYATLLYDKYVALRDKPKMPTSKTRKLLIRAAGELRQALEWFESLSSNQFYYTCDPQRSPKCQGILRESPQSARADLERLFHKAQNYSESVVLHPDEDLGAVGDFDSQHPSGRTAIEPLISVIVISCRGGQILRRALKSICIQTYPMIEIVLVYDGDYLPKLGAIPGMERLRAARFQTVSGIADYLTLGYPPARCARLRNYGVRLAAGEYVAFLDDDNEYEPDHLAGLMQTIRAKGTVGAFSYRKILMLNGEPYLKKKYPLPRTGFSPEKLWQYFCDHGVVTEGSCIFRDILGYKDEDIITVDTSEWLLPKWVCQKYPFHEHYTAEEIKKLRGEDYLFAEDILRSGLAIEKSERPTLKYYLGGYSNDRSLFSDI